MRAGTAWRRTMAVACAAVILVLAAALGSAPPAVAETPEAWDRFSEEEYRNFRAFFYDSFSPFFEIVDIDTMPEALDEFERSIESFPPELCSAVVDFTLFRGQLVQSAFRGTDISEETLRLLTIRIVFALAGVPWGPLGEVKPEDQPAALEAMEDVNEYLANANERLSMVHKHCARTHTEAIGLVSTAEFTTAYAPAPVEFRMRELYQSLIPAAAWILKLSRASESQDELADLESIIASMEQKYDLSVPGSH